MKNIIKELTVLFGGKLTEEEITKGHGGEIYIDYSDADFKSYISKLKEKSFVLTSLFCTENFMDYTGFTLFYVFEKKERINFLVIKRKIKENKTSSISDVFPSAYWCEREITDGFGVVFDGIFDSQRLFLHESYPDDFHPLLKSFKNGKIESLKTISQSREYYFKNVFGEGVYNIPVGPVHAGIIEPGHFRFSVIGETIFNLEVRLFYKHRGIEKLSEGKKPDECVKIAEAVSGDETIANAFAFSSAVEKISEISVPEKASYQRTIMLEMERIYSHLGDLSGMAVDVAFPVGASPLFILREEIFRKNEILTGSRFMRNIISIGGLKKEIPENKLSDLSKYLDEFTKRFSSAAETILSTPSVLDRFEKTGVVKKDLINPLNLTGPIARASGANADTRIDHSYGVYDKIKPNIKVLDGGDVLSRFEVKFSEVLDSARIIKELIDDTPKPEGGICAEYKILDGYSMSVVEAPRGQSVHWLNIKNGVVDRYKIRTPSFCNWLAIEHAVIGNIVPDFPLINKSMNLSYAGTDL